MTEMAVGAVACGLILGTGVGTVLGGITTGVVVTVIRILGGL